MNKNAPLTLALAIAAVASCAREPSQNPVKSNAESSKSVSSCDPGRQSVGADLPPALAPLNAIPGGEAPVAATINPTAPPSSTDGSHSHESLFSCFPTLDGWARAEPGGMSTPGAGGVMARCEYHRHADNQSLVAKIVVGTRAEAMLRTLEAARQAQPDPELVRTHRIEGIDATLYRDTVTDGQWVLIAPLPADNKGVFSISLRNVPPEHGLELAGRFDWKTLIAEVRNVQLPRLYRPFEPPI
ncbi:MAG TPA: hypothetical protein VLI39_15960 [Sedimentisphaerales bacterium]|nr:hypothetical protein [Sedimentisphaerales bacterium]